MTAKKDLKRRIRARQQRTGESYVQARRAVLAETPTTTSVAVPSPSLREAAGVVPELRSYPATGIEVVEMDDVSELAAQVGFKATTSIARSLSTRIEPRVALERLRDVLLGTLADPSLDIIRGVALRGDPITRPRYIDDWVAATNRFIARVRVGIGGVSEGGMMLAMSLETADGMVMMVCHLGWGVLTPNRPRLVLTTAEGASFFVEPMALRALAR